MRVTTVSSEIFVSFWFFQNLKTKILVLKPKFYKHPQTTPQHHLNLTPFLFYTRGGRDNSFISPEGGKFLSIS